jgi:large subunit ribosomal protein L9
MEHMPTEVILREHVEHLGRRGEVVKVADGYARNYLLPRRLALPVTEASRRQIERERVQAEAREAGELAAARTLAERIAALEIVVPRRVGEHDTLYGSVTSSDLAEALEARGLAVERRRIQLSDPLKTLGDHVVPVRVHREVTADLKVKIVPAD